MLYANEEDVNRCKSIVRELMEKGNISLTEDIIKKITIEIMSISYSTGGNYSDSIITSYAETYIEKKMFQKFLN